MNPKYNTLFLLSCLAVVILVSGCTGLDPTALAKSNSMIQQFLNEHPNAQIKVTHFTAEQAKNMIDQIRSDCDNPYLDEKEFYRVNVTDPETNFFAVVWIDWNNKTIECVFKLGTEGKVIEKPKLKTECESHSYYKCDSGNLYWFDSCGNKQEKKEYCQNGCSGQKCLGECKSNAEYRCYGGYVYWFDSCGNKQEKKEYCQYGCENGFCKTRPAGRTCEEAGGYCIQPYAPAPAGESSSISEEAQLRCEKKCAAPDIKFADFLADKETYLTGEVVRVYAKLVYNNGEPATPEQGNSVYAFAVSPTKGLAGGSFAPINYNNTTGYYEYSTPPVPSNVESGTWIFFATSENNESFVGSKNVYVKINPAASSESPSANPTPYEGCVNQCLLRFRMAQPLTAIISPSAASGGGGGAVPGSTGMTVATETTATSTIVAYQCKSGYETSPVYFCNEGGVCCIPKTTPTEFCGSSTQGPCASDSECTTGGCSGQVCQSVKEENIPTTCEYKDCYNAEKYGVACKCNVEAITPTATAAIIGEPSVKGRCMWMSYKPVCGNGVCESGEANECPECLQSNPPCSSPCKIGTCPQDCQITCTDTDGGKNYYQKGIAYTNSQELSDHCNDDGTLTEKYCSGGQITAEVYQCPYGCSEGACIKSCPQISTPSPDWCQNGTIVSGGKDENGCTLPPKCIPASCAKEGQMFSEVYKDYYPAYCCEGLTGWMSGMDTRKVENGVCVETGLVSGSPVGTCIKCGDGICKSPENLCNCPQDCKTVACTADAKLCPDGKTYVSRVPPNCDFAPCPVANVTCTDSDGGLDYYTKGSTLLKENGIPGTSNSDFCTGVGNDLMEYVCEGNTYTGIKYSCPYGCSDGACIQQVNQTYCGDTYCNPGETCSTCPTDCGSCPSNCTNYYDQVCPQSCAAGSDADCCTNAGKYWLQTSWGYGCYDNSYNPGCSAGKPCDNVSDQCCPNWCAAGSDIDCCTQSGKCWINNGCYTCQ